MSLEDALLRIFNQIAGGFWMGVSFLLGILGCIALALVIISLISSCCGKELT